MVWFGDGLSQASMADVCTSYTDRSVYGYCRSGSRVVYRCWRDPRKRNAHLNGGLSPLETSPEYEVHMYGVRTEPNFFWVHITAYCRLKKVLRISLRCKYGVQVSLKNYKPRPIGTVMRGRTDLSS